MVAMSGSWRELAGKAMAVAARVRIVRRRIVRFGVGSGGWLEKALDVPAGRKAEDVLCSCCVRFGGCSVGVLAWSLM
jgi:hypothetical protein